MERLRVTGLSRDERAAFIAALLVKRQQCRRRHDLRITGKLAVGGKPGHSRWMLGCQACANLTAKERRRDRFAATYGNAPVPSGLTFQQMRARVHQAERLTKYGPTGRSADGLAAARACARIHFGARHARLRQMTACKRGHPFTPENTYRDAKGCRACRTCVRAAKRRYRTGRPDWIERDGGVRISIAAHDRFYRLRHQQLRARMIAAHPDKGGTSAKFIAARKALARFDGEETAWYADVHLTPPQSRRGSRQQAAA